MVAQVATSAELFVVGSIVLAPQALGFYKARITPGMLHGDSKKLYSLLLDMERKQIPIGKSTVLEQVEGVGLTPWFVDEAMDNVDHTTEENLEYNAGLVAAAAKRMLLHQSITRAAERIESDEDPILVARSIEATLETCRQYTVHKNGAALELTEFGDDFEPVKLDFIWKPYLPLGKCVLLDADGGTGKSSIALAIAAGLSNGVTPVTGEACKPIKTLYLHRSEDQSDELETVYRANAGKKGFLKYCDNHDLVFDKKGLQKLVHTIEEGGFKLIVVDAFFYFVQGIVDNTNDLTQAIPVVERLNRLAAAHDVCFLNIRHTAKDSKDKEGKHLGLGASAWRNSHRGQLLMRYHIDKEQYPGLVIVSDEKGSILVPKGESFAFRRVGDFGEVNYVRDFDDCFNAPAGKRKPGPSAVSMEKAREALYIELCKGQVNSHEVIDRIVRSIGCSPITVRRAMESLVNDSVAVVGKGPERGMWSIDPFADEPAWESHE